MLTLDLPPEWLAVVHHLLTLHAHGAEVLAFGSRVQGSSHDGSDLDLVLRDPQDLNRPQPGLAALRMALSESNLPISVDVLDWALIPEGFRQEILRSGTVKLLH